MNPSDAQSGLSEGGYFITNDTWNAANYQVSQSIHVCSHSDWWAVAKMDNSRNDGAVKTYPNVHMDFNEPVINTLGTVTSTFAESTPHTGIYEAAYDIWINGVASQGSTELMIWNDNVGQTPSGSQVATVTLDGHSYAVWKSGTYIAFVAATPFTSATMNLSAFFQWIESQGWITSSATLGQVDYGAELVSTGGTEQTFTFTNFSVTTHSTATGMAAAAHVHAGGTPAPAGTLLFLLGGLAFWTMRTTVRRRARSRR